MPKSVHLYVDRAPSWFTGWVHNQFPPTGWICNGYPRFGRSFTSV